MWFFSCFFAMRTRNVLMCGYFIWPMAYLRDRRLSYYIPFVCTPTSNHCGWTVQPSVYPNSALTLCMNTLIWLLCGVGEALRIFRRVLLSEARAGSRIYGPRRCPFNAFAAYACHLPHFLPGATVSWLRRQASFFRRSNDEASLDLLTTQSPVIMGSTPGVLG